METYVTRIKSDQMKYFTAWLAPMAIHTNFHTLTQMNGM